MSIEQAQGSQNSPPFSRSILNWSHYFRTTVPRGGGKKEAQYSLHKPAHSAPQCSGRSEFFLAPSVASGHTLRLIPPNFPPHPLYIGGCLLERICKKSNIPSGSWGISSRSLQLQYLKENLQTESAITTNSLKPAAC